MRTKTPSGDPLLISNNEDVKIKYVINGKRKYDVLRKNEDNREKFQLIIRELEETDSGEYLCLI